MSLPDLPPVSAIADVLALWGMRGWLTPPLMPVVAAPAPMLGVVRTVQFEYASAGVGMKPMYDVLSADLTGVVLVLAGAAEIPGAVFGEILAASASGCGATAVLVDGAVRDIDDMQAIGMPVYATSQRVAGPAGSAHIVGVDTTVEIGECPISVADTVVVDASGCVRLAAQHCAAVLDAATRYVAAETEVLHAVRAGTPLNVAYQYKARVVEMLRAEQPLEVK